MTQAKYTNTTVVRNKATTSREEALVPNESNLYHEYLSSGTSERIAPRKDRQLPAITSQSQSVRMQDDVPESASIWARSKSEGHVGRASKNRASRMTLFGFRSRSDKADGSIHSPPNESPNSVSRQSPPLEGAPCDIHHTDPKSSSIVSGLPTQGQHQDERIMSTSIRPQRSLRNLRPGKSIKKDLTSTLISPSWRPPPLFQAYPQSLKHATLQMPKYSADVILSMTQGGSTASVELASVTQTYRDPDPKSSTNRAARLRKAEDLASLTKRDWTEKIFILVTEGYMLQYAGHGEYDRLPEKILPLCSRSAAFACDAIPGRPFVLQLSQICSDTGNIDRSRSVALLKEAGIKGEAKKAASALLLVLDNSAELRSWMSTIRKVIATLGGPAYNSRIEAETNEDHSGSIDPLHRMPSQRYLVKRDPQRFAPKEPCLDFNLSSLAERTSSAQHASVTDQTSTQTDTRPESLLKLPSGLASPCFSDTQASIAQTRLDDLRENDRRSRSTDGHSKTASTSRTNSEHRCESSSGLIGTEKICYAEVSGEPIIEKKIERPVPDHGTQLPIFGNPFPNELSKSKDRETNVPSDDMHEEHSCSSKDLAIDRGISSTFPSHSSETTLSPRQEIITKPESSTLLEASDSHRSNISPVSAPNFSVPTFSKRFSVSSNSTTCSVRKHSASQSSQTYISPMISILSAPSSPTDSYDKRHQGQRTSQNLEEHRPGQAKSLTVSKPVSSREGNEQNKGIGHDSGAPGTPGTDAQFSRRYSSLDYARKNGAIRTSSRGASPNASPRSILPPVPCSPEVQVFPSEFEQPLINGNTQFRSNRPQHSSKSPGERISSSSLSVPTQPIRRSSSATALSNSACRISLLDPSLSSPPNIPLPPIPKSRSADAVPTTTHQDGQDKKQEISNVDSQSKSKCLRRPVSMQAGLRPNDDWSAPPLPKITASSSSPTTAVSSIILIDADEQRGALDVEPRSLRPAHQAIAARVPRMESKKDMSLHHTDSSAQKNVGNDRPAALIVDERDRLISERDHPRSKSEPFVSAKRTSIDESARLPVAIASQVSSPAPQPSRAAPQVPKSPQLPLIEPSEAQSSSCLVPANGSSPSERVTAKTALSDNALESPVEPPPTSKVSTQDPSKSTLTEASSSEAAHSTSPRPKPSNKSRLRISTHRLARKSMPRLLGGRAEASPVFIPIIPPTPTRTEIDVSPCTLGPTENDQESAISQKIEKRTDSTHPFIPPIEIPKSRLSRGSMDGPWNAEYRHSRKSTAESGSDKKLSLSMRNPASSIISQPIS